ncbi:NAD(P)H-dependent glycerol-3-phosphate dehydrogenase [Desulfovibrio sp. SGI.169]|uniref:NAD(P)H-dependent glycerol-3-phosphate dehydrogenase n=1 Tax=Desulfovibrio sp. SGI.169 TaxID=3420561 RepID=UPI003D00617B
MPGALSGTTPVTVAGGGSWGTALAHLLAARGLPVTLWLRDADVARAINLRHENPRYLPGLALDARLTADTNPTALDRPWLVLAVPAQQLRGWLTERKKHFQPGLVLVNAAKGLETGSLSTCETVTAEALAGLEPRYAALSGPSFAAEVLRGLPTAVVLAARDETLGRSLRELFSGPAFRCYSSTDVTGVEMGGALKNVMAIAAGVCDGLGLGHNSRAALITRGLAEMSRLGVACGASRGTFMGLSGLGDLTLTCAGDLSRNRQVGLRLGRGERLDAITHSLGMVAEGVKTTAAVHALALRLGIDAPITAAMHAVLYEKRPPREALKSLMSRGLREE